MFNLVPIDPTSVSHDTNFHAQNDFYPKAINELLNDSLKRLAKVKNLSQEETVDLLHTQLTHNIQLQEKMVKVQTRKAAQINLISHTRNSSVYSLFI